MFRYHYLENLPEVFSNYFSRNDEIHHYNTRTSSQLHKSYKRTNYAKHTLSDKGVKGAVIKYVSWGGAEAIWEGYETKL